MQAVWLPLLYRRLSTHRYDKKRVDGIDIGHSEHLLAIPSAVLTLTSIDELQSKFCMEHIQNATLAGGVSVGATADMILTPLGAIIMGCLSGGNIFYS